MEQYKDSIRDLTCYGTCVQAKYGPAGLRIKNEYGDAFITGVSGPKRELALNIHLFNEQRLGPSDYKSISNTVSRLNLIFSIILSSSALDRTALNDIRYRALGLVEDYSEIAIATPDEPTIRTYRLGDMIYSPTSRSNSSYEHTRLEEYVAGGVPVLLDWQVNDNQCISDMIERTDASDSLIVLSENPKNIRQLLKRMEGK